MPLTKINVSPWAPLDGSVSEPQAFKFIKEA
jgi:hypothetical protein